MTYAAFASLVRYYTKTNSTTFTDANILMLANIFKDDIAGKIAKHVGEDYFGLRFTRNLVADQREYDLPSEVMSRMKVLEAKLNGTDWVRMNETDLNSYEGTTDETTIRSLFSGKAPAFDIWDKSIFIYSEDAIINVTSGLKLWCIIWPADFTDLTSTEDMSTNPSDITHGFPKQFHELLARRVSIAQKSSRDKPIPLSEKEQNYEIDLKETLDSMKDANLDRVTEPTIPYNDGSQY